jgi:hypothetical protein
MRKNRALFIGMFILLTAIPASVDAQPGACDPDIWCGYECDHQYMLCLRWGAQTPPEAGCFEIPAGCGSFSYHRCCDVDGLF